MTGNQGLRKHQSHTLVHIIDSKLLTAPHSSSVSLLEEEGAQDLTAADLEGHLHPCVTAPGLLSALRTATLMWSLQSPFFSPQQQL